MTANGENSVAIDKKQSRMTPRQAGHWKICCYLRTLGHV
jgi:hypothetical protein